MADLLGGAGSMDARVAEIPRLQFLSVGNTFAVSSASAAGNITTFTHTVPFDADLLLIFYMIRGGGSVLTSNFNPSTADPTVANTLVRTRAAPTASSARIECWMQRVIKQSYWGTTTHDIESTYSGTVNSEVVAAVSLSGVDPASFFADQTDTASDSAGSASVNIYGIGSGIMLSACCIRTSTSQTITKDASQSERVNLLTGANGLRGVVTSEYGPGDRDLQSFTFGDGTRPNVLMSFTINPVRGRATRTGHQPNLRAAPFQPAAKPFTAFRGW